MWASISHLPIFFTLFLFVVIYIGLCLIFGRVIERISVYLYSSERRVMPLLVSAFSVLLFTALLIIPMRGGLQLAPINQSSVYFSTNNFANLAAINAPWNFVHGLSNRTSATENPYNYLPPAESKRVVDSLLAPSGVSERVLNTDTPNVILIIWESFTDKATHLNVGGKEVTPRFNALKKEGLYFSRVYASGDRTDKGIAAVLSGYPALPQTAILRTPAKASRLRYLPKVFKDKGYTTNFYYGGETEFANIKSYILSAGFDALSDVGDYASKDKNSSGAPTNGLWRPRCSGTASNEPAFSFNRAYP